VTDPIQDLLIEKNRYDKKAENFSLKKYRNNTEKKSIINFPYKNSYYRLLKNKSSKKSKILELCAGEGDCSKAIIDNYKFIVFSDISSKSLDVLKIKFNKFITDSIEFNICNIESLPFKDKEFDIVACAGGLSYGDNKKVANEIYRVLKNNGSFICIDSLNENPLYKFNRYLHYLNNNRTLSTLKRMPNFYLLNYYKSKFGNAYLTFSGKLILILEPLSKILGYRLIKKISIIVDLILPNFLAFKFVMEAKKINY